MMLRPEPLNSEPLTLPLQTNFSSVQTDQTSSSAAESSEVDELIDRLVPQGISSTKRAIIETLIANWATEAKLDVA